jgi:transposase
MRIVDRGAGLTPGVCSGMLRRGSAGGGPLFRPAAYKQRNTVERACCKLHQHRTVATRYDKRDFVRRGAVDVGSIGSWLRRPIS